MQELSKRKQEARLAKIKTNDVAHGMYKNMHVCSDHFVVGTPSTWHDGNNQERVSSLKRVVETVVKKVHALYRKCSRGMRKL